MARRDVPFGEPERASRRALYRIDDPCFALWFRTVAPHRAQLASGTRATRFRLLERHFTGLVVAAWEELCRRQVPRLSRRSGLAALGPWGPCARWWHGAAPEWDIVSESIDGERLLLGEAKWSERPFEPAEIAAAAHALRNKPPPVLPAHYARHEVFWPCSSPKRREARAHQRAFSS